MVFSSRIFERIALGTSRFLFKSGVNGLESALLSLIASLQLLSPWKTYAEIHTISGMIWEWTAAGRCQVQWSTWSRFCVTANVCKVVVLFVFLSRKEEQQPLLTGNDARNDKTIQPSPEVTTASGTYSNVSSAKRITITGPCPSVCLSLSLCLSVSVCVTLSVCLPICLSVLVHLSSVCLSSSICLSLSLCLSVCPSIYLSVHLYVCLSITITGPRLSGSTSKGNSGAKMAIPPVDLFAAGIEIWKHLCCWIPNSLFVGLRK